MMNKFICIISLILIVGCTPKPDTVQPNVIIILVDDLGWRDVGFMGSTFYETPNIDKIASSGVVFSQAYAAAAICSPTRASILTGRYPARIGITDWIRGRYSGIKIPANKKNPKGYEKRSRLATLETPINPFWMEHSEVTLAELLKSHGYTTAHIGKWHLGPSEWSPLTQGYDVNIGGEDYGQPPTYFDPYIRDGFAIESLPGRKEGEYLTDRESDEAVDFIKNNHGGPFFLSLSHYAVHTPLMARKDYELEFKEKLSKDPSIPPWSDEDRVSSRFTSGKPMEYQKNFTYAAMIKSVDEGIGKITRTLDSLGISQNTIIVFFSDNGGHIVATDNGPLRAGKGFPYEGGIREPMIIKWDGVIQPGKRDNLVISNDFFPTIASLTNTSIPDSLLLDGVDLTPILNDKGNTLERNALFWHFPHYWWGTKVSPYSIVRKGDWKLIHWYETNQDELYDLKNDISESRNLSDQDPDRTSDLKSELDGWLQQVGAKLPRDPK